MIKLISVLLLVVSSSAWASDINACFNLCQLVTEESKNLKCEVTGPGAVLYLDVLQKPLTTREKMQFNAILSCYFKTGGASGEIHWADNKKNFASCGPAKTQSGYFCESTELKYSMRKNAAKK